MADDGVTTRTGRLRVDVMTPEVTVVPGEAVTLTLRVANASPVIETVEVGLVDLAPQSITLSPGDLKLFPEEAVEVEVTLRFPAALPAGVHEGAVAVTGASGHVLGGEAPLRVVVAEQRDVVLDVEPPERTAGRRAGYVARVVNNGNVQLAVQLRAADVNQQLTIDVDEPVRWVPAGGAEFFEVTARGRRPWIGPQLDHVIELELNAQGDVSTGEVRWHQTPRLSTGVLTALTLVVIAILWALAMLFGVSAALSPPEPVKLIPESFTAAAGGVGLEDLDASVVGGSVSGTVTATSTGQPVARVTVEAFDTQGRLVGATATGDDGTYELDSLLPSRYRLRIRAPGFVEQWYPGAPDPTGAELLSISPTAPLEGIDAQLAGMPGSLGGQVIAGDDAPVPVTVQVQPIDVVQGTASTTTTTDGEGVWSVTGIVAPATYRITYEADGYAPVEVTQPLEAGQQVSVNTVRLPAATGSISGTVVDRDGTPLGGIEIEAQNGPVTVTATTPTAGAVGTFDLLDLETPGTYLVTFGGEGRTSDTRAVRLGPGESLTGLQVVLPASRGVVTGLVTDPDGTPLGGATVTVSGGGATATVETFTSGGVGQYRVEDLPVPGTYAVTVEHPDHASETARAALTLEEPTLTTDIQLSAAFGRVTGIVIDDLAEDPLGGVTIEVSDGETVRTTVTTSDPASQRGRFVLNGLEPGTYTISAVTTNRPTRTLLRTIEAGSATDVTIRIGGGQ